MIEFKERYFRIWVWKQWSKAQRSIFKYSQKFNLGSVVQENGINFLSLLLHP